VTPSLESCKKESRTYASFVVIGFPYNIVINNQYFVNIDLGGSGNCSDLMVRNHSYPAQQMCSRFCFCTKLVFLRFYVVKNLVGIGFSYYKQILREDERYSQG